MILTLMTFLCILAKHVSVWKTSVFKCSRPHVNGFPMFPLAVPPCWGNLFRFPSHFKTWRLLLQDLPRFSLFQQSSCWLGNQVFLDFGTCCLIWSYSQPLNPVLRWKELAKGSSPAVCGLVWRGLSKASAHPPSECVHVVFGGWVSTPSLESHKRSCVGALVCGDGLTFRMCCSSDKQ